jgi:alkanesulfonate monooxygenase SsuD/methylene tetrahydromethanopterin reductase-like flavin-dependent oxidoreductase (luciferase family)
VGVKFVEHDKRYEVADDYLRCLYKYGSPKPATISRLWITDVRIRIWEASWADDALKEDDENEIYADFDRIRWIKHESDNYKINAPHIVDPSPQRTPFLFQAGTSS